MLFGENRIQGNGRQERLCRARVFAHSVQREPSRKWAGGD
jgi:hypothetical protein